MRRSLCRSSVRARGEAAKLVSTIVPSRQRLTCFSLPRGSTPLITSSTPALSHNQVSSLAFLISSVVQPVPCSTIAPKLRIAPPAPASLIGAPQHLDCPSERPAKSSTMSVARDTMQRQASTSSEMRIRKPFGSLVSVGMACRCMTRRET